MTTPPAFRCAICVQCIVPTNCTAQLGDALPPWSLQNRGMSTETLVSFSNQIADAVAAIAPSAVQVHGRRRPVTGIAYAKDIIITSMRALGREDGARVTAPDG